MLRNGELTSKQLVTIILIIVSFAVILLFFYMLNLRSHVATEACRNSIVLRGTAPFGKTVQLNCKTEDVCISSGGSCTDVRGARITKVANKNELLDELGNLMYDCWWQTGAGEIDYASAGFGSVRRECIICNRIYFDATAQRTIKGFTVRELYNHLSEQPSPDGKTSMLYALYKTNAIDGVLRGGIGGESLEELYKQQYSLDKREGYALVTAMDKAGWGAVLGLAAGGAVVGAAVVVSGGAALLSTPAAIGALTGGGTFGGFGLITQLPGSTQALPPALYTFNQQGLRQLGCYEVESRD
ncbi:MAG TPA: hypothetical protein VJK03_00160 [Candidatus Nanoarchaeia archaeon]|nr:hypothetical protein [Candidatus Nanoarchaeia archaeon]